MGKISDLFFYIGTSAIFYYTATYCIDQYFIEKKRNPDAALYSTLEKLGFEAEAKRKHLEKRKKEALEEVHYAEQLIRKGAMIFGIEKNKASQGGKKNGAE